MKISRVSLGKPGNLDAINYLTEVSILTNLLGKCGRPTVVCKHWQALSTKQGAMSF